MMILKDLLREAESLLRQEGIDSPLLSVHLLVASALKTTRLAVMTGGDRILTPKEVMTIQALVRRRAAGEPVAHLIGGREFYGLDFIINPDVLIPRPETELLIDEVQKRFTPRQDLVFADLGTGSGALAITMAVLYPKSRGLVVDVSLGALKAARENARRHGVTSRLLFSHADFRRVMGHRCFDLILSNPPYIATQEMDQLSREVRSFEPRIALEAGETGLEALWAVKLSATQMLKAHGWIIMEMGSGQAETVGGWFKESPAWSQYEILLDLAGLSRAVAAERATC